MSEKLEENNIKNSDFIFGRKENTVYILLIILGIGGIIIRLFSFPYDIPLGMDATTYFWYATDMSILGNFPGSEQSFLEHTKIVNNGWPSFLSIVFSLYNSNNIFDYMDLQRYSTIMISVLTIIPVYKLCSRFFTKYIAVFGAAIFIFEPRIILNSLTGTTEASFIFIAASSLALFFSDNKKIIYCSFALASILSLIRYEGLLLLLPLIVMFFVRFRHEKKLYIKYGVILGIIFMILIPMAYVRIETTGEDGLISHVIKGPKYYQNVSELESSESNVYQNFILDGSFNLVKFLGYVNFPVFILFAPLGALLFLKNKDSKKYTIIFFSILFLLPAFYAYSRNIFELRYLFILYPIFCLFALFTINKILEKTSKKLIISLVIISGIIIASVFFIDYKIENYEHEREAFLIAQHIDTITRTINNYHPEDQYYDDFRPANLETFPILSSSIDPRVKIIYADNFDSLGDFLDYGEQKGLSHLVIDDNVNRPDFLKNIFHNEEKYTFLELVFDSNQNNFNYHVKVFKIDFEKLNNLT